MNQTIAILEPQDVSMMEYLLTEIPSASEVNKFTHNQLRIFCHYKGIYAFPTLELISFLREEIGDSSAIEIGSGLGIIGKALGIPCTDSYQQTRPDIAELYRRSGQPTIQYGPHVEKLEAKEAIRTYRPHTVLACWVTDPRSGNPWGVKEEWVLDRCKKYIMVGNDSVHHKKLILKYPHRRVKLPGYISRSSNPDNNIIYIWENL